MHIFGLILGESYVLALMIQKRLREAYKKWGAVRNSANMTGAETTSAILQANDMQQIQVLPAQGNLTDHYNPRDKTIQLSEPVFDVPSVAAMAIAAHETGHAIQDKVGYWPLGVRTTAAYVLYLLMIGVRWVLSRPPPIPPPRLP